MKDNLRHLLRIINTMIIIIVLIYILFTHFVYNILINITGNLTASIYTYSKVPYYLLWLSLLFNIIPNILLIIINKIKKKGINIEVSPSFIFIVIILIASMILTPKFEFLEYKTNNDTYPKTIRYDKLFICNEFYSNEGDYEGGYGDTKYIYIPIANKMIYISSNGIKNYEIKYIDSNKVKIGDKEYLISNSWFTES